MTPNELKYSPIEKLCLALIFSIQKLKHYFQSRSIHLVSKANPLKYVMAKPVLSDRLARWYLQLQQFEITYVPQKAVKGQVLAGFLPDHPMPAEWELSNDLPDEDVIVIENCSNNLAEYQALILGLEIAVDAKQLPLKVYGDSQLVVNQLLGLYEVKKSELLRYHNYVKRLMGWLGDVELEHLSRKDNKQADALAKLASTLSMTDKEAHIPICKSWVIPPIFSDNEDDMLQEEENHVTELFEVVAKSKRDWHERIGEALWAYRTTVRTPTQATPYALVYGVEAVLPLEQQIPSLRIAIQKGLTEEENARIRLEELEALDEKRLEAQQRLECYQARLSRAFNKKVRLRSFQVGNLVLAARRPIITTHRTGNKFLPKWDGPYVVKEAYTNGAYKLVDENSLRIGPINGKFLKRYYA
ncbi:UNVERIFIED_CONTAM: hypothetical protein Sradi_6545200 [Sesamum radiatum]|uniref:RNase H type-1 domain-containing protein n=1 Tax=Sesamum radiatum TaxID=300843 RepID=A0AAW2JX67_SESRA